MPVALPLAEMSVKEKISAMESLWESLSKSPDQIESPIWHKQILDRRHKRASESKATFRDWETAKAKIRTRLP